MMLLPFSGIVPTRDWANALSRMFESLSRQGARPAELIVVDASAGDATRDLAAAFARQAIGWGTKV